MKKKRPIEDMVDSVCGECATKLGWKPKDKVVGVWLGECEVCGKKKPLTSLHHDWHTESSAPSVSTNGKKWSTQNEME